MLSLILRPIDNYLIKRLSDFEFWVRAVENRTHMMAVRKGEFCRVHCLHWILKLPAKKPQAAGTLTAHEDKYLYLCLEPYLNCWQHLQQPHVRALMMNHQSTKTRDQME